MDKYLIEIELLSEAIFGSGESGTGQVDVDILNDEYGIPYFGGKNIKGKLREEAFEIADILGKRDIVISLFGHEGNNSSMESKLRFSNCTIDKKIINNLKIMIDNYKGRINKKHIIDSFTDIRSFTSIENGVSKDGSLRQARVIKKGIKFYSTVTVNGIISHDELCLLCCAISSVRNLGSMESRGKGRVQCRLLEILRDEKVRDITMENIKIYEKEVL